jgi:cobalamin biosynthesis Mg chelatase CobN
MSKKPAKTEPSPELQQLEQKVDAMMNKEQPNKAKPSPATAAKKTSTLRVVSEYAGNQPTAPELSPKLLKTIKPDKKSAPEPTAPIEVEPAEVQPEAEAASEPEVETPPAKPPAQSIIDDAETDKAVADIVIREGDTQLAVEDAIARRKVAEAQDQSVSSISGFWVLLFLIIIVGTAAVTYLWFR